MHRFKHNQYQYVYVNQFCLYSIINFIWGLLRISLIIFFSCPYRKSIWNINLIPIRETMLTNSSVLHFYKHLSLCWEIYIFTFIFLPITPVGIYVKIDQEINQNGLERYSNLLFMDINSIEICIPGAVNKISIFLPFHLIYSSI